jgi:uncharacterized protein YraI
MRGPENEESTMIRRSTIAALFALVLLPAAASAQFAYTNRDANLRAGPNQEFPLVMWVPGGVQVYVNGCVDGFTWCDVTVDQERGWMYADFLSYDYFGQPVTIVSAGPSLGLPLITFSIGSYWDNYYRYRPWYGNRNYWYNRPPSWWYRPAPPPPPRPIVRPPPQRPPNWHAPGQRPPDYQRPPQPRPPDYRPTPQPRPPQAQPQPPQSRPPSGGRPSQNAPEYQRPSSPPPSNTRPAPQTKPDVRPAPQQQGGMVLKPDVGQRGQPYSQQ